MKDKQLTFLLLVVGGMTILVGSIFLYTGKINLNFVKTFVDRVQPAKVPQPVYPEKIILSSRAFANEGMIPAKYTCEGTNISPPLAISNLPENTKSMVLIVDDPDAPYQTWTHWIVINIDPRQKTIGENTVPWNAKLGSNDFGTDDYRGPCPPIGKHRYFFKLYALDGVLDLDKGSPRKDIESAMQGHVLDTGVLKGVFEK